MLHLVYASSAAYPFAQADLLDILAVSRRNNARDGVTGLLLYGGGNIIQVLEGEDAAVEATFARVRRDPRHAGLQILLRERKDRRYFGDWTMGFCDVEQLDRTALAGVEGLNTVLERGFSAEAFGPDPQRAHRLLLAFRRIVDREARVAG